MQAPPRHVPRLADWHHMRRVRVRTIAQQFIKRDPPPAARPAGLPSGIRCWHSGSKQHAVPSAPTSLSCTTRQVASENPSPSSHLPTSLSNLRPLVSDEKNPSSHQAASRRHDPTIDPGGARATDTPNNAYSCRRAAPSAATRIWSLVLRAPDRSTRGRSRPPGAQASKPPARET